MANRKTIRRAWLRLMRAFTPAIPTRADIDSDPPLRAQLFSAEQMGSHGKALAATHRIDVAQAPDLLLPRLTDNQRAAISRQVVQQHNALDRNTEGEGDR